MERSVVLGKSFNIMCLFIKEEHNQDANGRALKYLFFKLASAQKKEMI